ncbi:MAG: response regulator [Cyanobacteriota bacterium]|nr:response regulator [Cyanobacteriota bacterium]
MTPQMKKPQILVVDDEIDQLELLYRTFYEDYKVFQAQSGAEALEILAREEEIAVIISDQRMPEMNGTEFLRRAAAQYPNIMRIILTGYTDVEDLVEAINSGQVFKYVTKPWTLESLQDTVRQALETHNILKLRTEELRRSLRRESLLNTITNTIRNGQYGRSGESPLREVLQTIVNTLGQVLEVDLCILRPFEERCLASEYFLYQKSRSRDREALEERDRATLPLSDPNWELAVWQTSEIEILHDIAQSDRVPREAAQALRAAGITSTLAIPLTFQRELTAMLALHRCGEPQFWEDDEIQLAAMSADQAALAISQARAYERVQTLAQRESLVNTLTRAIRSSLEPQEIFSAITEQLGRSLDVDGCALSLWTEQDEFVRCVAIYNRNAPSILPVPPSQVPIASNPVLRQLLRTKSPVVLSDLEARSKMKGSNLPLRSLARALLVVPLLVDGNIIGSISLRHAREPRRWSSADVALARAVAAQAAIAVQQSRLYQKTRQQAERLLELDRQKTEFFQNISHELRTPLTLNLGPLEAAVAQNQGLPFEQTQVALRNSRRLLRLVNQLLDLQRLDAGRMQVTFRPCDLAQFIEQIVATFRPYCEKKRLELQTRLSPCEPIYLDADKFDKVLYNLLSNAMKFTHPGGSITVTLEPAGDYARLQVKDTGIGIARSQIPHLFERFRQAEGSLARSYEGTGLGLALIKEMVDLHGGQVTVESVAPEESDAGRDRGTTFTVWLLKGTAHLPLEQILAVPSALQSGRAVVEWADLEAELLDFDDNSQAAACYSLAGSPSRPLILVVEDNPDMRDYVRSILLDADYQACAARNGEEGWQALQANSPQLIITDLMMPKVSGLDLIHRVRNHPEFKGTPMILLTARADEESRISGTERGADAYVAKPFNDRELLAEVRNLLALKENERRVRQLNDYLTESVLARFLPPDMVKRAALGELTLDLQPEPRLVTVLFNDIVGFTPLANTLRSRCIAQLLNEYLAAMTEAIFSVGGVVDKFVGDAIVALFGAPEDLTPNEQVRRAIAAARRMRETLERLNARWQEAGLLGGECRPPLLQFRCGIHQGSAVVGMFGSHQRADYTAIGPTVNIASRLQQATRPNTVLLSSAVADYLDSDQIVKSEPLKLKGVDETILTFLLQESRSRAGCAAEGDRESRGTTPYGEFKIQDQ